MKKSKKKAAADSDDESDDDGNPSYVFEPDFEQLKAGIEAAESTDTW